MHKIFKRSIAWLTGEQTCSVKSFGNSTLAGAPDGSPFDTVDFAMLTLKFYGNHAFPWLQEFVSTRAGAIKKHQSEERSVVQVAHRDTLYFA
jgi:hypothetical protein